MRVMRVVVAPDSFGGTLTAVEAAAAIAAGWREVARAALEPVPMSDGGPGFLDVLAAARGGTVQRLTVPGPLGAPAAARVLRCGSTSYVEAAESCGLHLVEPSADTVRRGDTGGLGPVLTAAWSGAERVVVGLGGTGTNDGGAGLVRALGHRLLDPAGADLAPGGAALGELAELTPLPLVPPYDGHLVLATDVDNPLLGPHGSSSVYGPQKGADRATVLDLDDGLRRWADVVEAAVGRPGLRDEPGAGAAGGLGFALLALGGHRRSGVELVAEAVRLPERVAGADLVVTGEGALDGQSLRGKVAAGVARAAQAAGVPCVVVAGRVELPARELAAAGIDDAVGVADVLGSTGEAVRAGAAGVARAAAVLARRWSR